MFLLIAVVSHSCLLLTDPDTNPDHTTIKQPLNRGEIMELNTNELTPHANITAAAGHLQTTLSQLEAINYSDERHSVVDHSTTSISALLTALHMVLEDVTSLHQRGGLTHATTNKCSLEFQYLEGHQLGCDWARRRAEMVELDRLHKIRSWWPCSPSENLDRLIVMLAGQIEPQLTVFECWGNILNTMPTDSQERLNHFTHSYLNGLVAGALKAYDEMSAALSFVR